MQAMTERKLKKVVWDAPGEVVEGKLLGMKPLRYRDGGMNFEYKVRALDGTILVFQGATELNMKLHTGDVGCKVEIRYEGEDESRQMREGNNKPKLFRVFVDENAKPQQPASGGEITDDDIPF